MPLSFLQGLDPKDVEYIEKTLNLDVKAEVKDTVIRSLLNGKALERYYEWILEVSNKFVIRRVLLAPEKYSRAFGNIELAIFEARNSL